MNFDKIAQSQNISMEEGDVILETDNVQICPSEYSESQTYKKSSETKNKIDCNSLIPQQIILNTLQTCEVINAINPNEFYIQREIDYSCFIQMIDVIDSSVKTAKKCTNPEIGKIYLGKFTDDNNWYRAKVVSDIGNGTYYVNYIDYGNAEEIDISRMVECPEVLLEIPAMAIKCSLLDIHPIDSEVWSTIAIKEFKLMIFGQCKVMIYSIREDETSIICDVELRKSSDLKATNDVPFSIRKALSFLGYSHFRGKPFVYEKSDDEIAQFDRNYIDSELKLNTEMTVNPGKVHTPLSFYLYSETEMKMYELERNSLQEYCSQWNIQTDSNWFIFYPMRDMMAIAYKDGIWHRALINKVKGKGMVSVLMVDTGYESELSYTELRKIPDSFTRVPLQAIKCSLADIFPLGGEYEEEWTRDAINFFINWLKENKTQLKANVKEKLQQTYKINMSAFNGRKFINICQLLVEKNYATSISETFAPELSGYIDLDPHEDKKYASMNKTNIYVSNRNSVFIKNPVTVEATKYDEKLLANRVEINYLCLKNPDCVFVRFASQQIFSRDLERQLWQDWKHFKKPDVSDVVVGNVYGVEYKKNSYCRVKVLKIENDQCMTYLIDIGGLKAYAIDQLYLLPETIRKTKGFSAIVKLAGIIPPCGVESWPKTTIDRLNEVLKEKEDPFIMKCASAFKDPNIYNLKVLPVKLGWKEIKYTGPFDPSVTSYPIVNQLLVNSGLALPNRCTVVQTESKTIEETLSTPSIDFADLELEPESKPVCEKERSLEKFCAPEKPVKTWPSAEPLTKTTYDAIVTNVNNECTISFQLIEHLRLLQQMEVTYNYKLKGSHPTNKDLLWGVTSPVVALYYGNDSWYRAVVNEINSKTINVRFVDYGNNDDILVNEIRATDDLYMKTPVLCYKAELSEITPISSKWQIKELDYIHHLIVDQRVKINLLEPYKPDELLKVSVELADTKQDLASFLVRVGGICRFTDVKNRIDFNHRNDDILSLGLSEVSTEEEEVNTQIDKSKEVTNCIESSSQKEISVQEEFSSSEHTFDLPDESRNMEDSLIDVPIIDFVLPKNTLPVDSKEMFNVHLNSIVNARIAFVTPFYDEKGPDTSFSRALREIENRFVFTMKDINDNMKPCVIQLTKLADKKLWLSNDHGEWKRIAILEDNEDELKVRYFDYGREDYVQKSNIRELPQEAYLIPPMSMPMCIIDSESQALRSLFYTVSSNEEIIKKTEQLGQPIYASITENRRVPKVKLFIIRNGIQCNLFEYLSNLYI